MFIPAEEFEGYWYATYALSKSMYKSAQIVERRATRKIKSCEIQIWRCEI